MPKNSDGLSRDTASGAILSVSYEGPLPPAVEMEKYNRILPGAAERVFAMAEKDGDHRRSIEKDLVSKRFRADILGMCFAFSLAFICIIAAMYFFYVGNITAGFALLGFPVLSLIGKFLHKAQ
ncbi:MAG TPA: DUF2335 domain-containing protein [Alphaproteobacteria bacterium]|nr:DUF2335 domain-containing protein [Alphaproteobacteria bacterium]HOO50495.1 DUF2335 domain-containing protein [Alphaproteobacteria bacterium]